MRKGWIIAIITVITMTSGCSPLGRSDDTYPKRPKKTPYFYNETAVTEVNQDVCTELRRARKITGIEFVMVLVKKIPEGVPVGTYASELFDEWKVGSKTDGKGVLILFISDVHTLKIEVSYELEKIFTDAFCSSFQPTIKNYYAGKYFGDVFCGLILRMEEKIVHGEEADVETFLREIGVESKGITSTGAYLSGGAGIIEDKYYYDKDAKLSLIRVISAEKISEFNADKNIETVLELYFNSLEEGINYPYLDILTEGSQFMRLEYPKSVDFLRSTWREYQESVPYRIIYKDDLAAARFQGLRTLPIFLRRTPDGFWKIDVTKGWAFTQGDENLRRFPRYTDHPWMFAFPEYYYGKSKCNIPELIAFPLNLREKISELEKAIERDPSNASNYFKLGDIFYWECYWIRAAIDVVERGLELEPNNIPYHWLAIDMRYRFPSVERIPKHFDAILKVNPNDLEVLRAYRYHCLHFSMDRWKARELGLRIWFVESFIGKERFLI